MQKYNSKQFMALIMALIMAITCLVMPTMASPADGQTVGSSTEDANTLQAAADVEDGTAYVENAVSQDLNRKVTIMVELESETAYMRTGELQTASANYDTQMAAIARAERRIETNLGASVEIENRYSLLFNGFSFVGEAWMIDAINEMDGVSAFEAPMLELVEPVETEETETDLTPSMEISNGLTGASSAWDLGYTGKGMVVAVLDTGIRQTHEAFSVAPEGGKIDKAYLEKVYATYGDKLHAGSAENLDEIYYSEKLPFNWDYFDHDAIPNHTKSDHGSHVAGIAAGNNGDDFRGVAPDAQIVTMQVFTDTGGASFDTLMLALEDCVYLGVDVINMSLGSVSGKTAYESISAKLEDIYAALENAGISVSTSAGNETYSTVWTNYGVWYSSTYRWLAENPDIGLVGSPSTFPGSFSVASVDNVKLEGGGYIHAYGKDYSTTGASGAPSLSELASGKYEIVDVNRGTKKQIEAAGDVTGKIVIAKNGAPSISSKCANAAAAGAIAIIVYNSSSGPLITSAESTIPVATLSKEDGALLLSNFTDGVGEVTVVNKTSYGAVTMSQFSSWGATADLRIKPEIAAPGGNITSAIGLGKDDSYESWSGTSMAAPNVAGSLLLIKQHLREEFPDKTAAEINQLAYAFMMSTAHQVSGFVRQQGAGLMDVAAALTTDAYLTVPGASRPKLELDDSEDGVFSFSFEVNNFGDAEKTYAVVPSILTEDVSAYKYSGAYMSDWDYGHETGFAIANPETVYVNLAQGKVKDVTQMCDVTAPETVTVPAGQTVTINMTIKCNDELMAYFKEYCTAGMYLEGFIKLSDQDSKGVDLSIPFLGYVGDWDYPAMVDLGYWWQLPYGQNNMAQMSTTNGTYIGYGNNEQGLGLNYYADMTGQTYLADRNAISPNNDGFLDAVDYMEFSVLRNPRTVKLYVQDTEGNVVKTLHESKYSFSKEYWTGALQGGVTYSSLVFDYAAEELEENETAYIVFETWLDHDEYDPADNVNGRMVFPVTKDLTAPEVRAVDGGVQIVDANYTAYYAIYADEAHTEMLYETGVFAEERGAAEVYTTDLETYYVATADYARNEAFYKVEKGEVCRLDADAFGHATKTIVAQQFLNYEEGSYQYGWQSFNPETPNHLIPLTELSYDQPYYAAENFNKDAMSAAIGVDGTLYVNDVTRLYTMNPETFERTEIGRFWNPDASGVTVRNILIQPETYTMYAYARLELPKELGRTYYYFCLLDTETAEVTPLWKLVETGSNSLYNAWSMEFMDTDTLLLWNLKGYYINLLDVTDGTVLEKHKMKISNPSYGTLEFSYQGGGGDMLYDAESNCVYLTSNWSWFRHDRYNCAGMVKYDLNTDTLTIHTTGTGAGAVLMGMYFKEDVKPADFYYAMEMIDAIGEVDAQSGEAIKAAREAYEAVREDRKTRVENYATLIDAELAYYALMSEVCDDEARQALAAAEEALAAAQAAAEVAMSSTADNKTPAGKAEAAAKVAAEAVSEATTAAEKVYTETAIAAKATEEAAEAVEDGDIATAEEAILTAATAISEARIAVDEVKTAAADAATAQKSAELQSDAQAAQQLAEEAAANAAEAKTKAEEVYALAEEATKSEAQNKDAAYEALELAKDALDAAEIARNAAAEAAVSAADAANAADAMDADVLKTAYRATKDSALFAEVYLDIVDIWVEQILALIQAQEDQEIAEAEALAAAKVNALAEIGNLKETTDTSDYADHQLEDLDAAIEEARKAIENATTIEEVESIMAELKETLDTIANSCPAGEFVDVNLDEWYHEAVDFAVLNGLMNGMSDTVFAPNMAMTRAQMVTVLYRLAGEPSVAGLTTSFTDVPANEWYTDAVIWAVNEGIVKGISDTAFAPNANVTREQLVTILYRYSGETEVNTNALEGYTDAANISDYAVDAFAWAVENGIITGMTATTLAPQGSATRAQIATILMRFALR